VDSFRGWIGERGKLSFCADWIPQPQWWKHMQHKLWSHQETAGCVPADLFTGGFITSWCFHREKIKVYKQANLKWDMTKMLCYCLVTEELVSVSAMWMAIAYSLANQSYGSLQGPTRTSSLFAWGALDMAVTDQILGSPLPVFFLSTCSYHFSSQIALSLSLLSDSTYISVSTQGKLHLG